MNDERIRLRNAEVIVGILFGIALLIPIITLCHPDPTLRGHIFTLADRLLISLFYSATLGFVLSVVYYFLGARFKQQLGTITGLVAGATAFIGIFLLTNY